LAAVGVQVHIASHPDALVARLCDELARPGGGLFDTELVAVPSRGIERWLTQRIASGMAQRGAGDGICANVEFPSPRRLVHRVMETVPDLAGSALAWEGPALTAQLIETIDAHLDQPWMGLLARYLDTEAGSGSNRMAAAAKLAGLYDRYARRRPAMIRAWATGDEVGPDGEALPDEFAWQARLWRRLRDRMGAPSLPELLPAGLEPIRDGTVQVDFPDRLAVYGLTSTDPFDLEVLTALGQRRQVDLYVLHPSPALWGAIESIAPTQLIERGADPTIGVAAHPILEAWGRDSRELQTVLAAVGVGREATWQETPDRSDAGSALLDTERLLIRLQEGIRRNLPPTAGEADRSVQIHVCHGARRQVEVLRDAILHVLADRPELEPRDVVIMTPDLATFAPLLETAFPRTDDGGLPDLRLRIADRAPAATNPLVAFTARLLQVADGRLETAVIRDLVDRPPVQHKFGFDADTAGSIVSLVDDANVSLGGRRRPSRRVERRHRRAHLAARTRPDPGRGLLLDSPVRTVGGIAAGRCRRPGGDPAGHPRRPSRPADRHPREAVPTSPPVAMGGSRGRGGADAGRSGVGRRMAARAARPPPRRDLPASRDARPIPR
jgi:exodeoxyribonuclease V gamma subunit